MKTRIVLLLGLALAGCVPSWNPFYTEKDVVFNDALLGAWRPEESNESSTESWVFTKAGDKRYQLAHTDEEGRKADFEVRLFKLKDHMFLDLYLTRVEGDGPKVNAWASIALVPAHLLLKVEQIEPAPKLAAMNPDWMQKFLKKAPDAIAHRVVDGAVVLAANTGELQKFVLEHLSDPDFFGGAMELKRK